MPITVVELSPHLSRIEGMGWEHPVVCQLRVELSYQHPASRAPTFSITDGWDGTISLLKRRKSDQHSIYFPTGVLATVQQVLNKYEVEYGVNLRRGTLAFHDPCFSCMFDYQKEAIRAWIGAGSRGIIKLPCGAGKTSYVAAGLIRCLEEQIPNLKTLFLCERLEILTQSQDMLSSRLEEPVGLVGGGDCDLQPITVSTVQSLASSWEQRTDFPEQRRPAVVEFLKTCQLIVADECFVARTKIRLPHSDGSTSWEFIRDLVAREYTGDVISYNEGTKQFEAGKVVGWTKKRAGSNLLSIGLGRNRGVHCTHTHRFLTTRGWVEARNLQRGDLVICTANSNQGGELLSVSAKQIVLGSILGDGHLALPHNKALGPRLTLIQKADHIAYLEFKAGLLSCQWHWEWQKSGYTGRRDIAKATSPILYGIDDLVGISTLEAASRVQMLAVSIHYLDDGSYHHKAGSGVICVARFSDEESAAYVARLKELGFNGVRWYRGKKGPIVYIPRKDMERVLGPYLQVIAPPCMQYKLPPQYRGSTLSLKPTNTNTWVTPVRSVEEIPNSAKEWVYCLEVESSHNFVLENSGAVVSNCHHLQGASYQRMLGKADTAWFRVGLSGTPVSNLGLELLMHAAIGPVVFERDADFFINHDPPVLSRPTFWVYHPAQKRQVPPLSAKGKTGAAKYAAYYQAHIIENAERNNAIADFCQTMAEQGKSVAVLVTRIAHGEALQALMPEAVWLHGSQQVEYRAEQFERLRKKQVLIVISTLIREALDIPSLDAVCYACAGDSKVAFPQSWRCMRANIVDGKALKTECHIQIIRDYGKYFGDQAEEQLAMANQRGFKVIHYGSVK